MVDGSVLFTLRHERGVYCENCGAYAGAVSASSLKFLQRAVELFGPLTGSKQRPRNRSSSVSSSALTKEQQ
jgi:hypothetical protein